MKSSYYSSIYLERGFGQSLELEEVDLLLGPGVVRLAPSLLPHLPGDHRGHGHGEAGHGPGADQELSCGQCWDGGIIIIGDMLKC